MKSVFPFGDARCDITPACSVADDLQVGSSAPMDAAFQRPSAPYIEPLMGWTADDDTLSQVELCFPSMKSAVAYARRRPSIPPGEPGREAKPSLISRQIALAKRLQLLSNAGG